MFRPAVEQLEARCVLSTVQLWQATATIDDASGLVQSVKQTQHVACDLVLKQDTGAGLAVLVQGRHLVAALHGSGVMQESEDGGATFGAAHVITPEVAALLFPEDVPLTADVATVEPDLHAAIASAVLGQQFSEGDLEAGGLDYRLAEQTGDGSDAAPIVLTLRLATARPEGGFTIRTLTTDASNETWTVVGIEQTASLTPTLGLWELRPTLAG